MGSLVVEKAKVHLKHSAAIQVDVRTPDIFQ